MLRLAALLTILAPCLSQADRLISVPLGRKLPYRTARVEFMGEPYRGGVFESYVGLGVATAFDVEIRTQRLRGVKGYNAVDLSYNVIGPIPDFAPGISVGVQDVADATSDGRRFYTAVTYRQSNYTLNGEVPGDITLGAFVGVHSSAFVGVSLPFSREVRLLAEHNGYRLSAGFEIRPTPTVGLRLFVREQQAFASLSLTHRF